MNKEAIEQIQASVIVTKTSELTKGRAVSVPDDHSLMSLEQFAETRNRFRGLFKTTSLTDWSAYVNKNKTEDSKAFVDKEELRATAIFDLGNAENPLHCEHTASLRLESLPIWSAVNSANGQEFGQEKLAEWIEDWCDYLTFEDKGGEVLSLSESLNAIRNIQISSSSNTDFEEIEGGRKLSRSEQVEAKSKGKQVQKIKISCVPYDYLEPVTLEVRLNVIAKDKPVIRFRILKLAEIKEEIAQDFKSKINEKIEGIEIYVGDFRVN